MFSVGSGSVATEYRKRFIKDYAMLGHSESHSYCTLKHECFKSQPIHKGMVSWLGCKNGQTIKQPCDTRSDKTCDGNVFAAIWSSPWSVKLLPDVYVWNILPRKILS